MFAHEEREMESVNPFPIGKPDTVRGATQDFPQDETRVSGCAPIGKHTHIAYAVSNHRHSIRVEFRDENVSVLAVSRWLDKDVCPVDHIIQRVMRIKLIAQNSCVPASIALVNGSIVKRLLNLLSVSRGQLFCACHETARWIAGLVPSLQDMLSKVVKGACIRNDTSRAKAFELLVVPL